MFESKTTTADNELKALVRDAQALSGQATTVASAKADKSRTRDIKRLAVLAARISRPSRLIFFKMGQAEVGAIIERQLGKGTRSADCDGYVIQSDRSQG